MNRLKTILLNNIYIKLLALLIAFILWFAVMYNLNPIDSKTITVPVNIINDDALTEKNWVYSVVGDGTAEVTFTAKSFDLSRITESDFNLYVDMRYLSGSTNNEKRGSITAEIVNNSDIIESYKLNISYLEFELEEVVTREYKINIVTSGEAAENFIATTEPTAVPETITVTGRSSDVDKIASVVYNLDIKDASEEINQTGKPTLLDASGKEIEDTTGLTISPEVVQICLPIMQTKNVKISCDSTSGTPATGYTVSDIELDTESVKVAGYKAVLSNVTAIEIPAELINVEGLAQNKVFSVNLSDLTLPDGVNLVNSDTTVNVTVHMEKLKQSIYRLTLPDDISITGKTEGYAYTFDDTLVNITVEGSSEELSGMEAANIQASLDVSGYEAGTWSIPLTITLPDGIALTRQVEVTVNITDTTIEPTTIPPTEPPTTTVIETTTEETTTEEETTEEETEETEEDSSEAESEEELSKE